MAKEKIEIKEYEDESGWEKFVVSYPESNFLQSYYYGLTHKKLGKKVFFKGVFENDVLSGVFLAVIEDARRGRYLTIPGGPLIDWENKGLVRAVVAAIRNLAKEEKCIFVRLRPQIHDSLGYRNIFRDLGLRLSPIHLTAEHTLQLNLKEPEGELLSKMRKTTRYEIKKSEKLEIKVERCLHQNMAIEFYRIQLETARRQKFIPFSTELISSEFKEFSKHKQAVIYKATYKDKPLAYALVIHYPTESSYHFGASTEEGHRFPGAYAIQWEAIKDAKNRGIPRYNFWGIVDETQKNHRFYGVSVFKRGFGGNEIKYIPAYDLVINSLKYWPVYLIETIRRRLRGLG